jgi:AcrR family transcriptional regulator
MSSQPAAAKTATSPDRPRRTRLETDERRRQILACARRLFSERHYGAVSTAEIAAEAGVARGLLHHYFGSKRGLYLDVVRSMFVVPDDLFAPAREGAGSSETLAAAVDRWLGMAERNRETFLVAAGAQGFGRDPELEAIIETARERTADRVIELLRPGDPADVSTALRALVLAYGGMVQTATLDWLENGRLRREQVRELLVGGLVALEREVLPRVERA